MRITAGILVVAGLLVILRNFGFELRYWLAPALLIGLGLVTFMFPEQVRQWRAEQNAERRARRGEE